MRTYKIPRFNELPDFPIYADQVISFIENRIADYFFDDDKIITNSMINNYVKHGILRAPVNKKYEKDQIVYLIIICILKKSFTLEEISTVIKHVLKEIDIETSYNYYCDELENCLNCICNKKEIVHIPYRMASEELIYVCRSIILTVAYKIYFESFSKK